MGSPLHVMSTSSSLYTVTPSFVNADMVPSSDVFPTLISDDVKILNVYASFAFADSFWKGNRVTYVALLLPPLLGYSYCLRRCS